jgi:hypothetical protein
VSISFRGRLCCAMIPDRRRRRTGSYHGMSKRIGTQDGQHVAPTAGGMVVPRVCRMYILYQGEQGHSFFDRDSFVFGLIHSSSLSSIVCPACGVELNACPTNGRSVP